MLNGICSLWLLTSAVAAVTDCQTHVLSAYRNFSEQLKSDAADTYHVQIKVSTAYRITGKKEPQLTTLLTDIYARNQCLYYTTPTALMWQDKHVVVTVLKDQRTVSITRLIPGAPSYLDRILAVRDSIILRGKPISCGNRALNGQTTEYLALKPVGSTGTAAVSSIEFWTLASARQLQQVQINYLASAVTRITMQFLKQERLRASTLVATDARRQVLNDKGQLLAAYKGYRLVDQSGSGL